MTARPHTSPTDLPDVSGTIVGGPTPGDHGWVTFSVQVRDEIIVGVANPCGFGLRDGLETADASVVSAVMVAVSQFVAEHAAQMLPLYREAARLRRAAGNPPRAGNTRRGRVQISEAGITKCDGGAYFVTRGTASPIAIMLFREGGWIDHCDDWDGVSEEDRDEAFTVCLDYVFAHPDQATTVGLDLGLLDELWR